MRLECGGLARASFLAATVSAWGGASARPTSSRSRARMNPPRAVTREGEPRGPARGSLAGGSSACDLNAGDNHSVLFELLRRREAAWPVEVSLVSTRPECSWEVALGRAPRADTSQRADAIWHWRLSPLGRCERRSGSRPWWSELGPARLESGRQVLAHDNADDAVVDSARLVPTHLPSPMRATDGMADGT